METNKFDSIPLNKELSNIRIELGINAQKIMSHVQVHNKNLEKSIEAGITLALDEIFKEDNFERIIADTVKKEIRNTVITAASDWTIRNKIQKAIREKIEDKVDIIAEEWAKKVTVNLDKL